MAPDPSLLGPEGSTVTYLLEARTPLEEAILRRWLRRNLGEEAPKVRLPSSRRGRIGSVPDLERLLDTDQYLIPLRVVWLPPERQGRRTARWSDLLRFGDPRDPGRLRARWIATLRSKRVRPIAAPGATVTELRADHSVQGQIDPLFSYVVHRAWISLDRVERTLLGNRYKIPRFVIEAILSRRAFLEAVETVAASSGMDAETARRRARRYLREIAATHSPFVIDLVANAIRRLYRMGYGSISYSADEVATVAALGQGHSIVFLPSHRSNLDRLSLQYLLWENDLPPNHTAGGINMNFFPVGPMIRRTGVFFIRRSFRDNELYKTVLRAYLDYLVEKRFPLEWYLEGGRSRSGRLGRPRLGLLAYVADSVRRGRADDVYLIPVSIAYDQIQDVPDYAREARGGGKEKESLGWLLKAVSSLRRRYGDIHVRFGDPLPLSQALRDSETDSSWLHKAAFEVMHRVGRITPITPTSLVATAVLAARGPATAEQLNVRFRELAELVGNRSLPTTDDLEDIGLDRFEAILGWLEENGNLTSQETSGARVYRVTDDQALRLSYYRNVVVHFFVTRAIAEMALRTPGVRRAEMQRVMLRYRDLLKFEFFFPEKEAFLAVAEAELDLDLPGWERRLGEPGLLSDLAPHVSDWAVLPFLDAYQVVGDELEETRGLVNERRLLRSSLSRGRRYLLEGRISSVESVSQVLFRSALDLARNRGLLEDGAEDDRTLFAAEVREARRLAAG